MTQIDNKTSGKYSELPLRIASAVVLVVFALFCTWMGGDTFRLFAVALTLLVFVEFRGMVKTHLPFLIGTFAFAFLLLLYGSYFVDRAFSGIIIIVLASMILGLWEWVTKRSIWGAILLLYSALPFIALYDMRMGEAGLFVILFVFACVWGADTFAYFSGKTFGGPKLAALISPNKTWSGFIGGTIGAIVISMILTRVFGYPITGLAIVFSIFLALLSQIGDLFESWVKRRFDLKDSGKLIPGHGGILDRIDGLIFAVIAAWLTALAIAPQAFDTNMLPQALTSMIF